MLAFSLSGKSAVSKQMIAGFRVLALGEFILNPVVSVCDRRRMR